MKVGDFIPCSICGKDFKTTHNTQKLCGIECRQISKSNNYKKYYLNNLEKESQRGKEYRKIPRVKATKKAYMEQYATSGKLAVSKKKYRSSKKGLINEKDYQLQSDYGISLNEYNTLLKSQNDVCAICKLPETTKHQNGKTKYLAVDHCHKTGKVRGLLCFSCNIGLGKFQDSIEVIESAFNYLKEKL